MVENSQKSNHRDHYDENCDRPGKIKLVYRVPTSDLNWLTMGDRSEHWKEVLFLKHRDIEDYENVAHF